jgi:hypothetical protein
MPTTIAADGSLLADCPTSGTAPSWAGSAAFTLYRLAPGAISWATLGAVPGPWLALSATGQLWCWSAQEGRLSVTSLLP